ncbi:Zinc finger BED domain-containing protein 5 [Frankliniella fusca]|uniref:Zinc finger BED domain-containing protein 5 n=1 Tax=Frankliniella fusca TaxID=407009 RepID=A0AAE1HS60_9NEOP|nr:Zinc finger BED domain-containing protein 5 [Frankliniella fusca]
MVNVIKAHPLQTRLFKLLREEVGAPYTALLYYSKPRWLSRGKVTRRLITLRCEVREFLYEKESTLAAYWDEPEFVQQVAYLADVLEKLNELNVSLQGRNTNLLTLTDKMNGFQGKLSIWRRKALNDLYDMFLTLHELLEDVTLIIKQQIIDHLESLATKMEEWFGDLPGEEMDWVRNPFRIEEWNMPLKHLEELTDLQADRTLARKVMHIVGCMQQRIRL